MPTESRVTVSLSGSMATTRSGTESRPCDRRCRGRLGQSDVPGRARLLRQHRGEGRLPTRTQRADAQRPTHRVTIVPGQVEQCVDIGDRHPTRSGSHLDNRIAGLDDALPQDAQVEPGSPVAHQQRGQLRLAESHANPVAGDPRLADLEQRLADLIAVTHTDLVVGKPFDREVLAELAVVEVVPTQLGPPVVVGRELVHQHRPMRPAMAAEIALAVTVDVQRPDHLWTFDRVLPDAGVHDPATPGHVLGQPDIDRDQPTNR